ncbi:MAG: hypothetical protein H7Z10_15815, partial [Gemmatimonadaceae bacterium]|nr:hypothetical protein [Acetobacteraceae bacterium]
MPQRFFARAAGVLAAILIAYAAPPPASAREIVTDWTIVADRLGRGNANWRTMAIMHRAMHDAVNAAVPTYTRWHPAEPDEPRPDPDLNRIIVGKAALAASARQVLMLLHPNQHPEIDDAYARAIARVPDGP